MEYVVYLLYSGEHFPERLFRAQTYMHVHISEKSDNIRGHFYRPFYNVDANGETQPENPGDHCREKYG
jgi:hypothetical protein